MIGALVAILSLNLSSTLVSQGVVAGVLPVTGATVSTPINVTSPGHKIPKGRVLHGVLTGVVGMTEANGLWVFTPLDADTLTLSTFSQQGIPTPSVATNPYISGGSIAYAFPDYGILLGRRNVALSSSVASPRVVFVPTDGKAWGLDPYGGVGSPASVPPVRGTLEQQAERQLPQLETEFTTFEVYVTGAGPDVGHALNPDFADFDATQGICHALYATMFDTLTAPRVRVLHESWPSQAKESATMLQRGQQCCLIVEIQQPVTKEPLRYVPVGTFAEIIVEPVNPGVDRSDYHYGDLMPAIPTVNVTVQDNGSSAALSVPQASVQLKIGCAIGGSADQIYATTSPSALQTQFTGGPLMEAGGLVTQAGNVAICISIPIVNKGTASAVLPTVPGGSSSTITVTLDGTNGAWDTYYVQMKCLTGATIGVAGAVVQVSLDAGRNYGTPIALGTANTLVLGSPYSPATAGGTGITVNFGAGTLVAGDFWRFSTVGPTGNAAGVQAALNVFYASQFAVEGVGSIHIVGAGSASDITTIHTTIQAATAGYVYTRAIVELRDASPPVAWGGSGETEATWIAALATITSGLTAQPRIDSDGGYYNTPSPYANPAGGAPSYRRPLAWAHAVRRTQIPLQRRAGAVKNGPLANIAVNAATDPNDGFIYHDERVTPGLNAARIGSAMTWPKKGRGFYMCQEPLLSAPGSQFTELVIGNVLDVACDIGYAAAVEEVSDDLLLQSNGTLDAVDRNTFQGNIQVALNVGMIQTPLVSSVSAIVSPTANVGATGIVPITIAVQPRGYVNAITETISLSNGA